jgi:hypothetical protein
MILSVKPVAHAWQAGWTNLGHGLAITRRQPGLYLELCVVYGLPPVVAAWLVVFGPQDSAWDRLLVLALPWITLVVAPVVLMHAVAASCEGERLSLLEATRRGVPSVPIYVWTNVHTTVLFWLPIGLLLLLHERSPLGSLVPGACWLAVIAVVAVHQHVRTVLAPYLAVHGACSGTHAALTSWRLGGVYFWRLLGTFAFGSLPVAVPLLVCLGLLARFAPDAVVQALVAASLPLSCLGLQSVRPVLVPALHSVWEQIRLDELL